MTDSSSPSPYPDYQPSAAPGHPQPYPSPSPAGAYGGAGHGAYTGADPFAHPGYPGGHPATGPAPYPYPYSYPYSGGYYPVGMLPLPLPPQVAPLPGASPVEAVRRFFRRYAQFRGYASRSEFWWIYGIITLLIIVPVVLLAILDSHHVLSESTLGVISILGLICLAAIAIPFLALSVRRLHDTGNSGWMVLLNLLPFPIGDIILIVIWCQPSRPERYRPEWS